MQAKTLWPNIVLGVAGLGTSAWAVHVHRLAKAGKDTGCGYSNTISCDRVMTSKWGEIFGISLGYYGLLFFAIVILMAIATRSTVTPARAFALQNLGIATIGTLSSMALLYISLAVIKSACPVCMATHTVTSLLFVASVIQYLRAPRA